MDLQSYLHFVYRQLHSSVVKHRTWDVKGFSYLFGSLTKELCVKGGSPKNVNWGLGSLVSELSVTSLLSSLVRVVVPKAGWTEVVGAAVSGGGSPKLKPPKLIRKTKVHIRGRPLTNLEQHENWRFLVWHVTLKTQYQQPQNMSLKSRN